MFCGDVDDRFCIKEMVRLLLPRKSSFPQILVKEKGKEVLLCHSLLVLDLRWN